MSQKSPAGLPDTLPDENRGELLLYQSEGDGPRLEVRLHDESVWLSLNQMAELFQVDKSGISRHLKNVFESGELQREATVANFAIVHTAAELIFSRADAEQPQMGITNFPGTRLLKRDVEVAKNYLDEAELNMLNRIVTAYLEVAEIQAMSQNPQTMRDWAERMSQFLTMTGRELLTHAGKVSHEQALQRAHAEYDKYKAQLLAEPTEVEKDFVEAERELKQIESAKKGGTA